MADIRKVNKHSEINNIIIHQNFYQLLLFTFFTQFQLINHFYKTHTTFIHPFYHKTPK